MSPFTEIDLKELLGSLARQSNGWDDPEFNPMEYSGSNYDDAFSMGVDHGRTLLAREIMKEFFV